MLKQDKKYKQGRRKKIKKIFILLMVFAIISTSFTTSISAENLTGGEAIGYDHIHGQEVVYDRLENNEVVLENQANTIPIPCDFKILETNGKQSLIEAIPFDKSRKLVDFSIVTSVLVDNDEGMLPEKGKAEKDKTKFSTEIGKTYGYFIQYIYEDEIVNYSGLITTETKENYTQDRDISTSDINIIFNSCVENTSFTGDINTLAALGPIYEAEPNDDTGAANTTYNNYNTYGKLSTEIDVDFYKVTIACFGGVNFSLSQIPTNCDYDMFIYKKFSDGSIGQVGYSNNSGQTNESFTHLSDVDTTYYIEVQKYGLNYSASSYYNLLVVSSPSYKTWYSALTCTAGTTYSSINLNKLFFPNMADCSECGTTHKCRNTQLYEVSISDPNKLDKGHINKWGCTVSSMAMILKNMAKSTSSAKVDHRGINLTNGNMPTAAYLAADPYTCTMANILWPACTVDTINQKINIPSYTSASSPVNAVWGNIATGFNATISENMSISGTPAQRAYSLNEHLKANPEGIIVRIGNQHTIVFTGSTYPAQIRPVSGAPVYEEMFICYDPGTSNAASGNGVVFKDSYSGGLWTLNDINYIKYLN